MCYYYEIYLNNNLINLILIEINFIKIKKTISKCR